MKIRIDKDSKRFIEKNLRILTSKSKDQIKHIKRQKNIFWRPLKNIDIPKNPDLALKTVKYLIDKNKIKNQEDLEELLEISDYIKKYLYINDLDSILEMYSNEIDTTI